MKRAPVILGILVLVLFVTMILAGDSAKPTATQQTTVDDSVVQQQVLNPMDAATQELQLLLQVISSSVPVSTWEPEQPTAQLVKEATCVAPANDAWQVSWAGAIAGERSIFDENIQKAFAGNGDYEVRQINPEEYAILGKSGFNAGVRWNEAAGQVQLELESACFQDTQPAS